MPTTVAKKPQRTMKIPRVQIRGFASDTLVARWSTYWFQSLGGGDSISSSKPPPYVSPTLVVSTDGDSYRNAHSMK
jgi:hypothetical protein